MATQLKDFVYSETLASHELTKSVVLLGTIKDAQAVVTITRASLPSVPPLPVEDVKLLDSNDIYSWGVATLKQDLESAPGAKIDVVYPATETHIAKYRTSPSRLVVETPEIYESKVLPYIRSMQGSRLDWVKAILFKGAEADRVLHRDDDPDSGFVLLPNSKWDRRTVESLYLLVIVLRDDLGSIRDLTSEHVPMLQKIKHAVESAVKAQYGLDSSQLKLYFHYQPSYYHLHIHVANVGLQQMDFGRSILVDNVIDMLTARPGGLKTATLSYILSEGHELWQRAFAPT